MHKLSLASYPGVDGKWQTHSSVKEVSGAERRRVASLLGPSFALRVNINDLKSD